MRRVRGLEEIIAGQLEDAEAAERREQWAARSRLSRFTVGTKRWTKALHAVAGLMGVLGIVVAGAVVGTAKLYRGARKVYAAITLMRVRGEVGPADLPVTGQPTIATDRIPEPKKGP